MHELNRVAREDINKFIRNPVNCFLIIKQLTVDIENMLKKLKITPKLMGERLIYIPF